MRLFLTRLLCVVCLNALLWLLLVLILSPGPAWGQVSPYTLFATTCPSPMPTNQCCYDTDSFTLACGTGSGTVTFSGMSGTGTANFIPRFATGGTNIENSSLFNDPATGNIGNGTQSPTAGLHVVAEGSNTEGDIKIESFRSDVSSPSYIINRARGTAATPAILADNDIIGPNTQGFGFVRNAANLADEFVQLGIHRFAVDGLDAQNRAGARWNVFLSPGVSAAVANVFSVTNKGNVGLSATQGNANLVGTGATRTLVIEEGVIPSTSPVDKVQLTGADRGDSVAGTTGLHVRAETGTVHYIGDRVGFGVNNPATFMEVAGTLNVTSSGEIQSAGVRVGHNLSVYASGTSYSLTATAALLNFGTTDPVLTISQPGTYMLFARAALNYNAATYAASETVSLKIRRTNNTPADIANSTITTRTRIITTVTDHHAIMAWPMIIYTTALSTDSLELQGSVSTVPSAGSHDVYEASLVAVRLF